MEEASGLVDSGSLCAPGDADAIPVDTSGFDHEAWLAELVAELEAQETLAVGIDRTLELRAQQSKLMALEQRELAELAMRTRLLLPADASPKETELAMRSLIAELAVAHRVSDRTMATRVAEAETLVWRFPTTWEYLELGRIQAGHVRTIVEQGLAVTDRDLRVQYEIDVLEHAVSMTPGRLRRFAQLAAARVSEIAFEERQRQARSERSVAVTELGDGMSQVTVTMPMLLAAGVWDRLTQQAKAIRLAGDERSFDQLRADLVAELLLTGQPSGDPEAPHAPGVGIRAEVSIVIPMLTMLGQCGEPATLTGSGPIDLDTARKLAGQATRWLRILTDPVTDLVVSADTYRPSKRLRRFLEARDGRCRFPTCNRSPGRSDIDHTIAWEDGGRTVPDNLAVLCRGHHILKHYRSKHRPPWSVRQTAAGEMEWRTPSGRLVPDVGGGVPSGWRFATGAVRFA